MKNNIQLPDSFIWGASIDKVMQNAQDLAKKTGQNVEFDFNGVLVVISASTNLDHLYRDYMNAHLMKWSTIGSDCVIEYSPETFLAIENRQKEQDEKRRKQLEEWERKDKLQRETFKAKVADIVMEVSDIEKWNKCVDKNTDPYGKCAVNYARDWARLMQYEMANGKKLSDIADSTSHELGFYGITGFMYGCAVQMLSQCWKHGEELRKWHNKEYNHEGDGVVNPAILTIG